MLKRTERGGKLPAVATVLSGGETGSEGLTAAADGSGDKEGRKNRIGGKTVELNRNRTPDQALYQNQRDLPGILLLNSCCPRHCTSHRRVVRGAADGGAAAHIETGVGTDLLEQINRDDIR